MIPSLKIHAQWTLFLDRDGVINTRIVDGYVMDKQDFILIDGVLEAMKIFRPLFQRIIIVTNQQCVGKELCSWDTISEVHRYMLSLFADAGTPIDAVCCCPHKASENCDCRKPKIGLACQAKTLFPEIDFQQSIMVGDMPTDLLFGRNCGMKTVFVGDKSLILHDEVRQNADLIFPSLYHFAKSLL